jgi:dsRNA-specific ribonuclease
MGAGRILYEDWICEENQGLGRFPFISDAQWGLSLCLVTNLDLVGVITGSSCVLNDDELEIVSNFSQLVHLVVFDSSIVKTQFELLFAVVDSDDNFDFDFMRSALSYDESHALNHNEYPTPPFLVYSTTSKRLHRVDEVLATEPHSFYLKTANWKPLSECGSNPDTLADYYMKKYGIDVKTGQSIFISPLGSLINARDLVASRDPVETALPLGKSNPKNLLYLVPQLVRLSPLTKILDQLCDIPKYLFWIERGLVARDVARIMDLDLIGDCVHQDLYDKMLPSQGFVGYASPAVSLVSIALTCPGADLPYNYERLEWLGDTVLRTIVFDELQVSAKIANEVLSNERLGKLCCDNCPQIPDRSVLCTKPSLRNPSACRSKLRNLRILADIVEALVCCCYIVGGIVSGVKACKGLGIIREEDLFVMPVSTPSTIRLEKSIQTLVQAHSSTPVGELDSTRNQLVSKIYSE